MIAITIAIIAITILLITIIAITIIAITIIAITILLITMTLSFYRSILIQITVSIIVPPRVDTIKKSNKKKREIYRIKIVTIM